MPIVVAADSCHDDTAALARLTAGLLRTQLVVMEGTWRTAGRARAAAVESAMQHLASTPAERIWIANTDADCVVPSTWLQRQLAHAADGADAVAGIVDLDERTTGAALLREFRATYRLHGPTHAHAHAANLGVRADAYRAVGGWGRHVVVGEDHHLVRRLTNRRFIVRHPTDVVVTTSSRTVGRLPAGFATRLAGLAGTRRSILHRRDPRDCNMTDASDSSEDRDMDEADEASGEGRRDDAAEDAENRGGDDESPS